MVLRIQSKDSTFSRILATAYIDYLNEFIKTNTQAEARENVMYLDSQLVRIIDPLLREKIQGLIANEIEKEMVVSKEAFKVIDPVFRYSTFKEKKMYPLAYGAGLFFLTIIVVFVVFVFTSAKKTGEDLELVAKLKKEIRSPF